MFGGFAPPQLSPEELRQAEAEANFTIQTAVATAVALYLCKKTPKPLRQPLSGCSD
ncbi:mitochondrial import receptor subunit OR translocase-domain-containing protein [Coniochaeta sp. 2T2.1]|nr:mitochondrial import receptor subunit OR translocase-domain-containing protein [Coniochaeta sp. 2T2.1]